MDDSGVISSMIPIPYVINYHGFKLYRTVPVSQGLIDSRTPIIYDLAGQGVQVDCRQGLLDSRLVDMLDII